MLKIDLAYFAGEKTEKATPRKKRKAREEGQVAKSQEVNTAFLLLAAFSTLGAVGSWMYDRTSDIFGFGLALVSEPDAIFSPDYAGRVVSFFFFQALLVAMPILIIAALVGVIANLVQVGWQITPKAIQPKFSKLNPLSGFKRIISFQSLMTLLQSLVKFTIIIAVIYSALRDEINHLQLLSDMGLFEAVSWLGDLIIRLGLTVGAWFIFVAAADYAFTRWKHLKDLRMSKQEIKEEFKQSEGNPQIKGRIRSKMQEASMRRMMEAVPNADVIVTNPSHYAVALAYDRDSSRAPCVTAKGVDFLARKIKEKAEENGVEIVENKELARALYATVDIGQEIPPEMYQAVAEILAFVYKLKKMA